MQPCRVISERIVRQQKTKTNTRRYIELDFNLRNINLQRVTQIVLINILMLHGHAWTFLFLLSLSFLINFQLRVSLDAAGLSF